MFQFLAVPQTGCRRWFPRHLLHPIATLAALAITAIVAELIDTKTVNAESIERPNIVLIMADDQGWGDVGYYGHDVLKTPTLDAMAASALRLDRFYAAAPVCSPTRGSVMTGRHPNRFGCFSWGHTLRPQEITVAEALKTAGYATGHFGKWHLGSTRADSPVSPGNSGFDQWFSSPNFYENDPLLSHNGRVIQTQGESSQVTVEKALEFIRESHGQGRPFLAVVWFGSPHTPHVGASDLLELYNDQPPALQNYYAEITGIDRAMGHLRSEIRKLGVAENTLLWYTSDNGPQGPDDRRPGSAGGLSGRKGSLWEGGVRVPTILEWPARITEHRKSSIAAGTVDIYPTLLELAGVTMPDQPPLDGRSLVSLIDGKMTTRDKPLGFWVHPARGRPMRSAEMLREQARGAEAGEEGKDPTARAGQISRQYPETELPGHAAWIDGDFKLHRIPQAGGQAKYQLFNLAQDAQEKKDLIATDKDRAEKMQAALHAWQTSVIRSLNGQDYK